MNTISEHSAVVNMYGKTTELQKKILSHDTPESTFLKSVLDKYGEITDENYKEIKKNYMNILESSLPTDGYFELASDFTYGLLFDLAHLFQLKISLALTKTDILRSKKSARKPASIP